MMTDVFARTPQFARAMGLVRYFSGKPCAHGHAAERFTSTRACVTCLEQKAKDWKRSNPAKCNAQRRAWVAANPERNSIVKATWNKANPEGQRHRSRKWYEQNKEKADAASAAWRARNPGKLTAAAARRRAAELLRTPVWADQDKIEAFYEKARILTAETGVEHHVDHIVPLRGKTVSGLHVETNLQILPAQINRSKSNRFEPVSLAA